MRIYLIVTLVVYLILTVIVVPNLTMKNGREIKRLETKVTELEETLEQRTRDLAKTQLTILEMLIEQQLKEQPKKKGL